MSLITHSFFPRSAFNMDYWLRPESVWGGTSTLDVFDPFDDLDRALGRNLMWLDVPDILKSVTPFQPRVPKKYRIQVDCRGFNPNSIQTQVSDDKKRLIVNAKEGQSAQKSGEDYTLKEFRKSYDLPDNVETDKLVSFMTSNGRLVVEIPLRREEKEDEFPRIKDQNGEKSVEMNVWLPKNIDPSKVKVTCKDRDVIVQAEDEKQKQDEYSKVTFYRRTTLPENTDLNSLKCTCEKNQLRIQAPILGNILQAGEKTIPIQMGQTQQSFPQGQQQQQQVTSGKQESANMPRQGQQVEQ
jgi:HSP20 family molecular chaperone IbpA